MKRKNLFLSILCGCTLLVGCNTGESSATEGNTDISELNSGMEIIVEEAGENYGGDYSRNILIFRNVYTDVLYLWCDEYEAGGLVEMHNPETGLPLTYKRYKEIYHERPEESETQHGEKKDVSEVNEGSCPECENKIEENVNFCSNCGAKQEVESNEQCL